MVENFMYYPKDYAPAIRLALNGFIDDMIIHDFMYREDNDMWYVELTEPGFGYVECFSLQGVLVRSCYKAVQMGITRWTKEAL